MACTVFSAWRTPASPGGRFRQRRLVDEQELAMGVPRRFAIPNDCLSCTLRRTCDFCNLPQPLMTEFNSMGHLTLYPGNATLLTEGQVPRGVYIACSGRAKLSVEARDGKTIILKIAGDRQVLGLSAVVSGGPSLITVTTIDLCQIKFVERDSFLRLIERDSNAALACAAMLAHEITTSFDDVHELLLARSSTEKLARLLLSWVSDEPRNRELRVSTEFTHEEIAQMIGSSRETVTRLLSDMKRKDLIRLEGATLVIPNRIALQAIAS
ncbi:MAG TPA: Crp/Fnr family transcriptional regulator [Terriglobales bacterium]|nr:Crp/Fnr family transcriptional regulator [Terriglobales bacterium]